MRGLSAEARMGDKTRPVRLTDEAIKWARIASGHTGESMAEYVSRITVERGMEDEERYHKELAEEKKAREAAAKQQKPPGGKPSKN